MRFVIINLTNKVIPITRTDAQKVNLIPHKPYVMETMHNPEIKFWQSCTDARFKIISNPTEIDRYLKVLANQVKHNTANNVVTDNSAIPQSENKEVVEVTPKAEPVINEVNKVEEVVSVTEQSDAVTTNNNVEVNEVNRYSADDLVVKKVVELKAIASELNIAFPSSTNKAGLIDLILKAQ